jgi:arylsulfatase A-like enzyme
MFAIKTKYRFVPVAILISVLAPASHCGAGPRAGARMPNVVFILADDLGWADPGRYHEHYAGTPALVPTPNMNRLCDEGMMFTDAQLPASLCAPNRFCLMTGNNPYRSRPGGTWNRTQSSAFHFGVAADDRLANPHRTIGDVLQDSGYRNAFYGKMHLGGDYFDSADVLQRNIPNNQLHLIDYSKRFRNGLLDHGFDYTFVNPDGIQGPMYLWFENDQYRPISDFAALVDGVDSGPASALRSYAGGETVGDGQIVDVGYGDSRFDTSDHGPILSHFAVKFIEDQVANHPNQPFMLYYATPAIHLPITPSVDGIVAAGATGLGDRSDFVSDLDQQVGRILGALDRLGIANNTLVIFTSDNGGHEAGSPAGQDPNGPWRGYKGNIWEGGHRVPFIWKWGDGTAAGSVIPPGKVCNQLVSPIDWVPSLVDLSGGTVAQDQHQDSTSLLPLLFSETPDAEAPVRQWMFLNGSNRDGIRMDDGVGKWVFLPSAGALPIELYSLVTDPQQANNLVAGYTLVADVPADHSQKARIQLMNTYYLDHNTANEARTTVAMNFRADLLETPNAIRDPGFEESNAGSSQPDADTLPWFILNQPADKFGSRAITNNGTTARSGSNMFSFQYFTIVNESLAQDITFPIDASQPHELSFWSKLGEASTNVNHTASPALRLQVLASPGGDVWTTVKTVTNLLPVLGSWTKFIMDLSPAELSAYNGQSMRITLKKINSNTAHRIAIDDFNLSRGTPFGEPSMKTPIPVPVLPPTASIVHGAELVELFFSGLDPGLTYHLEEVEDLSATWSRQASITGQASWNISRPVSGFNRFYRAAYPAKVEQLVLPP